MNTMKSALTTTSNNNKSLSEYTKTNEYSKLISVTNSDYSNKKIVARKTSVQPLKRLKLSQTEPFNKVITTVNMETDFDMTQQNNNNKQLTEEFFLQLHPFSDFILIVEGKEIFVDKSVLSSVSKIFQLYFQDQNISSMEIVDVSSHDMIELLQFLYPQFQCTMTYQNVTDLLILAHRFEIHFILTACHTFILLYLSKFNYISTYSNGINLIEQENGLRLAISSIIDTLCIWFREFFYMNDQLVCENLLNKLCQCNISNFISSKIFNDLEEKIKYKIFQARAKHLENQSAPTIADVK
ncbi:unnamed protein product [Rotaria socialis]|uniref:BTB domain-containing protein n=2 Tax=Rotaria socialis TaxID=392032 RepID=A0A821F066_9BILA|nr:unnamed protein product [Rotaria socialis]CAF4315002.1 unnamed protein product [Rotaria socialis]CAF4545083.1 unnamed protein product [Rotaria socialis]CAF4641043.1 unnamed protein product [Rotaria socialis]